jgi:hypothetical protein
MEAISICNLRMHHAKVARDPPNMVNGVNGVLPCGGSHFRREFLFIRIELPIVRGIFGSRGCKKLAVLPCWLFFIEIFVVLYFNTYGESGYQNPPRWSNG